MSREQNCYYFERSKELEKINTSKDMKRDSIDLFYDYS